MKLVKTKLNGLDFWYREDDEYIGQRIALGKYEEYETKLLLEQTKPTSVVFDIGANIGYYTLLMAQKAKKVYAFEPEKEVFGILKKNVEENNLKNVVLFNKAVGDKNRKVGIIKNNDNFGDNRIVDGSDIDCVRLDEVIGEKVDLMKIDTQGWEPKVIEGAKEIILKDTPILFLEYSRGLKMINFLKGIYKDIWSVDYWYYICRKGVRIDPKDGYVDLWITNKINFADYCWMIKNANYKKIFKGIIGYGKNKQN